MKTDGPLTAPLDPARVQRAAQDITAGLQRVTRNHARALIAVTLVLLLASGTAFHYGSWLLGIFLLIVVVGMFLHLQKRLRRRRMDVALPYVLQALVLEQAAGGQDFTRSLPARLFPRVAEPLVTTVFSGTVGDCPVAIAEIEVRDRNDDSDKAIFEGLVLRVGLPGTLPDFLILDEELSRKMENTPSGKWFFNKPHIDVGFLQRSQALPQGAQRLGLWLSATADPAGHPLADVLQVLTHPPQQAAIDGRIHSATNDGTALSVALRPADRTIRIDATTIREAEARLVIRATHDWLAQPMALAKALILAHETALAKS